MNTKRIIIILAIVIVLSVLGVLIYQNVLANQGSDAVTGSGTVEAVHISISPELSGKVSQIYVAEGDAVSEGDPLFVMDGSLLDAQRETTLKALQTAQANYDSVATSRSSVELAVEQAQIQYELALAAAQASEMQYRQAAWLQETPDDFETPVWYFDQSEELAAAESALENAATELGNKQRALDNIILDEDKQDLLEAEKALADAQVDYQLASALLVKAKLQDEEEMENYAQLVFDDALAELQDVQQEYEDLLDEETAEDLLQARTELAAAQDLYDAALDYRNSLLTGEDSLQVRAAKTALEQAEQQLEQVDFNISSAEAAVAQVEAEIALLDVQIEKLTVYAPVDGLVLSRNLETGEVVQAGASVLTLGQIDDLSITVYISEDIYGEINLGDDVQIEIDSFPEEIFDGTVIQIADQAEFTPRNVQTEEGRSLMVFAVKLSVQDPGGKFKPGMPATVTFSD